ncbi:unnamed protein product [Tuber melanosporum]|uniref:(Perigord truffle) hypothetical protein n=1 Tax=Tuber melanosporum (strain Mel28) TaxID=656061 RepID=D5GN07_TUBMM|nr:uncharacterized protein GSTUM_00011002001 [Tuber melanosporum]CAZ85882.1 unnamed protein product [Tuber melanosporum]
MTQLRDTPRKGKEPTVSRPKEPEIGGSNHENLGEYPTDLEVQPCIPLIFVMGVSGAGKSSFIKTLGGKDSKQKPPVTSATESVTREVKVYKTILDGQEMLLVDTPGFEDNKTLNPETFRMICEYVLQVANNPACIIRGAIYVHNIATSRWIAGDKRTWSMLKKICGDAAMGNVIVATTRWPADHEDEDYEKLERRNLEKYWEGILGTVRLAKNDVQHSSAAIRMLFSVHPKPFQVQWELSDGNTPSETSAGRISMTEGEEALSEAEKEKEYALAELGRVSSQIEPVRSQNAPKPTRPPLPETKGPSAANLKKEMNALLQRLESAIHASKLQVKKIKSSEKTLQEEIQQVQALLKEKEDLLKKYHQLRRKIESADKLKARLSALRTPISTRKVSRRNLLAMLLVGGAVVVDIGSMSFPFHGFAAFGGVLLYEGVTGMMSKNTNSTPKKEIQTPDREYQIPTLNMEEGARLNDGSDGDDERIERRKAWAQAKAPKMKTTRVKGGPAPQEPLLPIARRRSSWSSFWV